MQIQIKDINKYYNKGKDNEVHALKNANLEIEKGELIGVVGKSGSGKSTLLHILGCVDDFQEGTYLFEDEDISRASDRRRSELRNEKIGIVLQDFGLVEECTALENVMIPLYFSRGVKNKKHLALEALTKVGLYDLAGRKTSQMSGGQKQRVAIARAIVNSPSVILADEPTGALDVNTSGEIVDLLKELNARGITVIIITHDLDVAAKCTRCITIEDGIVTPGKMD